MKKGFVIGLMSFMLLTVGCQAPVAEEVIKERPVEVATLKEREEAVVLVYLGVVEPKLIKKYAFLSGGRVDNYFVAVGDPVEEGTLLAALQSDKFELSANASSQQVQAAYSDYEKVKEQVAFLEDQHQNTSQLLSAGAATQNQMDELDLQLEIAKKELKQASNQYQQAKINQAYQEDVVKDAVLISDMQGVVVEKLVEKGEIVGAGYPSLVVRSQELVVKMGVTAEDYQQLSLNMPVSLRVNQKELSGEITSLKSTPDPSTRLYEVIVSVDQGDALMLGQWLDVKVPVQTQKGIWLHVKDIQNDGEDFVYVIKEGRAERVNITILGMNGSQVMVEGLSAGQHIVIKGADGLSDGYRVKISGGQDE